MKKTVLTLMIIAALAIAGCKDKPKTEAPQQPQAGAPGMPAQPGQMPPGHPGAGGAPGGDPHAGMKAQEIPAGVGKKAKVLTVLNAKTYTYLEVVDEKGQKLWLALPEIKIKAGESIEYPETPPLTNFQSPTLNRTFEKLAMVPGVRIVK